MSDCLVLLGRQSMPQALYVLDMFEPVSTLYSLQTTLDLYFRKLTRVPPSPLQTAAHVRHSWVAAVQAVGAWAEAYPHMVVVEGHTHIKAVEGWDAIPAAAAAAVRVSSSLARTTGL
jgi:hypothetical protein